MASRCKLFLFVLQLLLDTVDLVSDWLLYVDVQMSEPGLVYGPPGDAAIFSLLAFSIVGTFTFFFESVNLWRDVFKDKAWVDVDLVSAVTIWIEDLPQIAINVWLAWCREDPISVFQLSKASVAILEILVRILIVAVKYCRKKYTCECDCAMVIRVFIMLGLVINFLCAGAVFFFTQTQREGDGDWNPRFQVPEKLFEDEYNDARYFQNVNIFIHHPYLDAITPNTNGVANVQNHWVRLMSINEIRGRSDVDIRYNIVLDQTSSHLNMAFFVREDRSGQGGRGRWNLTECYQVARASGDVSSVSPATCLATGGAPFLSGQALSLYISFSFTPPAFLFKRRIFGDILYNIKSEVNGACGQYGSGLADSVVVSSPGPVIHYYRVTPTLDQRLTRHLWHDSETGTPRFYRSDGRDLEDVSSVWKTGWGRCESSGSKAPTYTPSLPVTCSNKLTPAAG